MRPLLVAALVLSLGACGRAPKSFDLPEPGAIPKGSGLFSGRDGEFVIYSDRDGVFPGEAEPPAPEAAQPVPAEATSAAPPPAPRIIYRD